MSTKEQRLKCRRETSLTIRVDGRPHKVQVNKRARPEGCELCGKSDSRLGWHHWDDDNLNKGIWICQKCHFLTEFIDGYSDQDYLHQYQDRYLELKARYDKDPPVSNYYLPREILVEFFELIFNRDRNFISEYAAFKYATGKLQAKGISKDSIVYQLRHLDEVSRSRIIKEGRAAANRIKEKFSG